MQLKTYLVIDNKILSVYNNYIIINISVTNIWLLLLYEKTTELWELKNEKVDKREFTIAMDK